MAEIKICPVCGREFTDRTRKYCSPKCSKEGYQRKNKKNNLERYHKNKKLKRDWETRRLSPLEETARRAREAGMTYGQYVALEYARIKRG